MLKKLRKSHPRKIKERNNIEGLELPGEEQG